MAARRSDDLAPECVRITSVSPCVDKGDCDEKSKGVKTQEARLDAGQNARAEQRCDSPNPVAARVGHTFNFLEGYRISLRTKRKIKNSRGGQSQVRRFAVLRRCALAVNQMACDSNSTGSSTVKFAQQPPRPFVPLTGGHVPGRWNKARGARGAGECSALAGICELSGLASQSKLEQKHPSNVPPLAKVRLGARRQKKKQERGRGYCKP